MFLTLFLCTLIAVSAVNASDISADDAVSAVEDLAPADDVIAESADEIVSADIEESAEVIESPIQEDTLGVGEKDTNITFDIVNNISGSVAIDFRLTTADGEEIPDANLTVSLNNTTETIKANHVWKNANLTEGKYVFNVTYAGLENSYNPCNISVELTVMKNIYPIFEQLNAQATKQLSTLQTKIKTVQTQLAAATVTYKSIKAAKTVKKSAKKLVITVTLKKQVKGKKVHLSFNGKTYSKKTTAKGIAKFTISKSVLKKLKLGKLAYQVIVGDNVAKKSITVKK